MIRCCWIKIERLPYQEWQVRKKGKPSPAFGAASWGEKKKRKFKRRKRIRMGGDIARRLNTASGGTPFYSLAARGTAVGKGIWGLKRAGQRARRRRVKTRPSGIKCHAKSQINQNKEQERGSSYFKIEMQRDRLRRKGRTSRKLGNNHSIQSRLGPRVQSTNGNKLAT